jgi:hypothetical protein
MNCISHWISHHIFLPFIATVMKRLLNLYAKPNACRCLWLNALLSLCPLEYRNSDWLLVIVEGGIAEERVDISLDCGGGRGGKAVLTSPGRPNARCSSCTVQYEPANFAARLWNGGRGFGGPGLQRDPPHSPTHTIHKEEKRTALRCCVLSSEYSLSEIKFVEIKKK